VDDNPDATAVVVGADDAKEAFYPTNLAYDRGVGNNNVTNRYILSGVWNLDGYASGIQNNVAKQVLGGWELSGIFNAQSGQPYSAKIPTDINGDGNSRTDRVPGYGRNTFNMPGIYSVDPRVTKTFAIHEVAKVQLIGEAFNLFNHGNYTAVNSSLYKVSGATLVPQTLGSTGVPFTAAFGVPTAANVNGQGNVGRVLQLAAKITF
jgi:hypothetical protein